MAASTRAARQYLVTGITGQLGTELLRRFEGRIIPKTRETLDLTDMPQLIEFLGGVKPAAVVHAAAQCSFPAHETRATRQSMWDANVTSTDNLAKACAQLGIPLVFLSCDQVFSSAASFSSKPFKEAIAVRPVSYYGMTKVAAEHCVLRLAQCLPVQYWRNGFKFWIVRTSFLIDRPSEGTRNVLNQMLQLSKRRGEPVPLPEDVICSPIYVPDLVEELAWILENRETLPSGIFHVASIGAVSLYSFANAVIRGAVTKTPPCVTPAPADRCETIRGPAFRHLSKYSVLDCAKYTELTGRKLPTWQLAASRLGADLAAFAV